MEQEGNVFSESAATASQTLNLNVIASLEIENNKQVNIAISELPSTKTNSIKLYLCCYIFLFMYLGAFYSIPSAIFNSVQLQLHISTKKTGLLWSVYDITYGISAVISGIIIDIPSIYQTTHKYIAIFILVSIILLCIMSLIKNYLLMILIWILLSYSQGIFDCCIAIYIYKLYLDVQKSTILLTVCNIIALVTMTLFLPIIDLSLTLFQTYKYSMYLLTLLAVPSFILTLILSPPKLPLLEMEHASTNSDVPLHSPQLTLINNFTSINIAGILGLGLAMNKTTQNNKNIHNNISYVTSNAINTEIENLEVSKTINLNTPATPHSPSISASPRPSASFAVPKPRASASWFDVEDKLQRFSRTNANDLFMLAFNVENRTPKHDKILGLDKQNKFDHKMQSIRETIVQSMPAFDIPSSNESKIIHDFNAIQQQKSMIKLFAVLNMCLMAMYQSQNVIFGAYISIYAIKYVQTSEQIALLFVTAFFSGITLGRCMTIYLLKKCRSDDAILFCCVGMFINGLVMLTAHILYDLEWEFMNKAILKIVLYIVLVIAGILSSPLFNTSYSFLSLIQPITGFVTSLLFGGYCIGGAMTAFVIGIFVDMFGANIVPYCVVLQLFICMVIAIFIKVLFVEYHTKYLAYQE